MLKASHSNRARINLGDVKSNGRGVVPPTPVRLRGDPARKSANRPGIPIAAWSIFRHSRELFNSPVLPRLKHLFYFGTVV